MAAASDPPAWAAAGNPLALAAVGSSLTPPRELEVGPSPKTTLGAASPLPKTARQQEGFSFTEEFIERDIKKVEEGKVMLGCLTACAEYTQYNEIQSNTAVALELNLGRRNGH